MFGPIQPCQNSQEAVREGIFRSHSGTLALKTEEVSKKESVVLVIAKMDLLKSSLGQKALENQGEERYSNSIFAFYYDNQNFTNILEGGTPAERNCPRKFFNLTRKTV